MHCELQSDIPLLAQFSSDGTALVASQYVYNSDLNRKDFATAEPYLCAADPTDNSRITQASPGQLITLYANDFGGEDVRVSINGVAAPLLYTSQHQINAQVPLELTGKEGLQVLIQSTDRPALTRPLAVTASSPSAFLDPSTLNLGNPRLSCNGVTYAPAYQAITRNEDGSLNTCANPAAAGSMVTFYLIRSDCQVLLPSLVRRHGARQCTRARTGPGLSVRRLAPARAVSAEGNHQNPGTAD